MKMRVMGLLVAASCLPLGAQAMELQIEGERAVLSGEIDSRDFARLQDAFDRGVKVLLLQGVSGERTDATRAVAGVVARGSVTTVAVGTCAGGCAYLFLRGKERLFADRVVGRPATTFVVQGSRFVADLTGPAMANDVYAYFRAFLAPTVSSELIADYTNQWTEGKALVFFGPTSQLAKGGAVECLNILEPRSCRTLGGLDPLKAGVVTSVQPYKL